MDITVTFQLTAAEYRSAIRNSSAVRSMTAISLLAGTYGLLTLLSNHPLTWVIYYGFAIPVFLELAAVRLATRKSTALFAAPWTVGITEQTYTLKTAASQAEVDWSAYREAFERSGFWYLRQTNGVSGFFPKRALDAAQQAEVAEFFARRLPRQMKPWYRRLL